MSLSTGIFLLDICIIVFVLFGLIIAIRSLLGARELRSRGSHEKCSRRSEASAVKSREAARMDKRHKKGLSDDALAILKFSKPKSLRSRERKRIRAQQKSFGSYYGDNLSRKP